MGVIWKIAFRNLREHKIKTLIIGVIISIGITVLVVGNSLMDTATAGIKRTYIDNYTGHIIITGKHNGILSLFGSNSMDEAVPMLPEYEKVREYVATLPEVASYSPQAVSQATVSLDDEIRGFVLLFGIDSSLYKSMFPHNIELLEGEFLKPGEEGIVLSEHSAKQISRESGKRIVPGDAILLTAMNFSGGARIREVHVRGIFRFRNPDPQLNYVSLMDITNLRALAGMNVQAASDLSLEEEEKSLLGELDEDALFGSDNDLFGESLISDTPTVQQKHTEGSLLHILGDTASQAVQADSGAWHFLLLKVKNPARTEYVRRQLEQFFAEEGIEATTQGWVEGAGVVARMTSGIKLVFNIIIFIVAVVAVIIIMNTLVISVTERMAEIGAMRAIGAQKSFVRRMITFETIVVSGVFGLIGILTGSLILLVLNVIGMRAPNFFFRILFGGEILRPVVSLSSVLISLLVVTVIGVVASLYPVSIALKIQPVKAMQGS